jgi:hypothetical protein
MLAQAEANAQKMIGVKVPSKHYNTSTPIIPVRLPRLGRLARSRSQKL